MRLEIIVEEKPDRKPLFSNGDIVPISVHFDELELREQLRKLHARWDSQLKLWFAPYRLIQGTALEERIVAGTKKSPI